MALYFFLCSYVKESKLKFFKEYRFNNHYNSKSFNILDFFYFNFNYIAKLNYFIYLYSVKPVFCELILP